MLHNDDHTDSAIYTTASRKSQDNLIVVVVAADDDNGIFILCFSHTDTDNKNMYMVITQSVQTVYISIMRAELDSVLLKVHIVLHSITDSDTTSRPYSISKRTALDK